MRKIYSLFLFLLFLVAFSFDGLCQILPISEKKDKEAMVIYSVTIGFSGAKMELSDTLLIRNSFVLEPIKEELISGETNVTSDVTKYNPTQNKLQWYYMTDLSKMIGMAFNVEKQSKSQNIKTFTSKSKKLGYGMSDEPFLVDNRYNVNDYSKIGDTIFNGQKCIVIKTNKRISVTHNSIDDELLYTKMFINPQIKDQNYTFISDALSKHFGGAIIFAESSYKSGVNLSMTLKYKTELTPAYSVLFDKYQALYSSNITLLDKLEK